MHAHTHTMHTDRETGKYKVNVVNFNIQEIYVKSNWNIFVLSSKFFLSLKLCQNNILLENSELTTVQAIYFYFQ